MDDTDRELIGILRDNARTPIATLASRLRITRATVMNRLSKLEQKGVIHGYTVRLQAEAETRRIRALMSICVEGNHSPNILKKLRGYPSVQSLYITHGRWDIIAELRTETLEAFETVIRQIRLIEGIATTETSLLLSTQKA